MDEELEFLRNKVAEYRITNRRLNRRCSKLESRVAKYRRRCAAVKNVAKEWHDRAKWDAKEIREIRKDLWRLRGFGYWHWNYLKYTLREANNLVSRLIQNARCWIQHGHFFDKKYWDDMKRLRELEEKVKQYENRDSRL